MNRIKCIITILFFANGFNIYSQNIDEKIYIGDTIYLKGYVLNIIQHSMLSNNELHSNTLNILNCLSPSVK